MMAVKSVLHQLTGPSDGLVIPNWIDLGANLQEVIDYRPIAQDLAQPSLGLGRFRLDSAQSLVDLKEDLLPYRPHWLLNKVCSDKEGFTAKDLSRALKELHVEFESALRYRGCSFINPKPALGEHIDKSIKIAWKILADAGIKSESRFGEILEWMIRMHDAGEILGEFSTESERQAERGFEQKAFRARIERRIASLALVLKIDSIIRNDSNQFDKFVTEGRNLISPSKGRDALIKASRFLLNFTSKPLVITDDAMQIRDRLMVFYDAVEDGVGFAAATAKVIEKLETFAYVADKNIPENFEAHDIVNVIKYPRKAIRHIMDLAQEATEPILIKIANAINIFYEGKKAKLIELLKKKL